MINVRQLQGFDFRGWQLGQTLGEGADGVVYVGTKDGQQAAIKIFIPESIKKNGLDEERQRLELQLRLQGPKQHKNLVQIFEGGEASELGGTFYLIMELVSGASLDKVVHKVPDAAIPNLLGQLVEAARFLESRDLIHRDIKPANIMVSDDFAQLTLLDLGVIIAAPGDEERISGKNFVATTRYSPPEFVWRSEESSDEAWRAITFYQIGATLHDLLMHRPIFAGNDEPFAVLIDSVRYRSPEIAAPGCDQWLVELAKRCLVKDPRERLQLLSWDHFLGPPPNDPEMAYYEQSIQLRQIRNDEIEFLEAALRMSALKKNRVSEIWNLQNGLFLEIRQFLMSKSIFPRFSGTHKSISDSEYALCFAFEKDRKCAFSDEVVVEIFMREHLEASTELRVTAKYANGEPIFEAQWLEILTIGSSCALVQRALYQIADKVVPSN